MIIYSAAGICSFHSYNKECVISLSAPLLKLRPRKDLVETLLVNFLININKYKNIIKDIPKVCSKCRSVLYWSF